MYKKMERLEILHFVESMIKKYLDECDDICNLLYCCEDDVGVRCDYCESKVGRYSTPTPDPELPSPDPPSYDFFSKLNINQGLDWI
jgi:hypothetical protein